MKIEGSIIDKRSGSLRGFSHLLAVSQDPALLAGYLLVFSFAEFRQGATLIYLEAEDGGKGKLLVFSICFQPYKTSIPPACQRCLMALVLFFFLNRSVNGCLRLNQPHLSNSETVGMIPALQTHP